MRIVFRDTLYLSLIFGLIGYPLALTHKAASVFGRSSIGAGRTIEDAYNLGCVQIRLQGIPEHLTPVHFKRDLLPLHQPAKNLNQK